MQKPCAVCGKPFEAQRPQAKYCGETCKKRAQRAGTATSRDRKKARPTPPPTPPPAPVAGAPTSEDEWADAPPPLDNPPPGTPPPGSNVAYASVGVTAATVKALVDADRLDTVLGQLALKLAVRLEGSIFDTGSSFVALSKELRTVTELATAGAHVEEDEVDELQQRRDEKMARAAAAAATS